MANRVGNIQDNIASSTNYSYNSDMMRNLIINPKIEINQRGATSASTDLSFVCDRWRTTVATSTGTIATLTNNTADISSPLEGGISKCIRMDLSGVAWNGLNYYRTLEQVVEMGYFKRSMFGTTSPKKLSLAFWVKSNRTGTFTYNLASPATTSPVMYIGEYTINSADTWERKTFTVSISAGQSAFWNTMTDTDKGLIVRFIYGAERQENPTGSGGWLTSTANPRITPNSTILNIGDYMSHTGVQLEVNDFPTPFQSRPQFQELKLCRRYYIKLDTVFIGKAINTGDSYSGKIDLSGDARIAPALDTAYTSTFTVSTGLAGTVALRTLAGAEPSQWAVIFYNTANNWTANADIAVLAYLNMELV